MTQKFDYFVIYAGMRTGSNFLESNINMFEGLKSFGEAFNPSFIAVENQLEMFGQTIAQRDADPMNFIRLMQEHTDGIPGFRLFHDHDPRIIEATLNDPRCGKIILSRNLVESWVSMRIAWSTNQWWLDDAKNKKDWKVKFNVQDFEEYFYRAKGYHQKISRALQVTGQTGYYIDYEDIQDLEVINGLARFLGSEQKLTKFAGKFKKQNPEMLADKVRNFDLLEKTVNEIDRFDLGRMPYFEPKCGPMVPSYHAGQSVPLLFMPVRSGPHERVLNWMAALNGTGVDGLLSGFTQQALRKWKRQNKGHRSFTVLRHPAARLHDAFCRHILPTEGPGAFLEIRQSLKNSYGVPLPDDPGAESYDRRAHRAAFLEFLKFVKGNINLQTAIRVDHAWATQDALLQGFGQFVLPDHILREEELEAGLGRLCDEMGLKAPPLGPETPDHPFQLADIHDDQVEDAVKAAHQRDYLKFGFRRWK